MITPFPSFQADDPRFPVSPALQDRLRANGQIAPAPFKQGPIPAASIKATPPPLAADGIDLGNDENGHPFGIVLSRLVEGRLLIQGNSGAGKSWLLRRLLEGSSGTIQQIVIDPEGEFRSLAESADYPLIDPQHLNSASLAQLAFRVREQRISVVIDVSQLDRERQMTAVAAFLEALIECPRESWHPALVAIDEAHLFAPCGGVESAMVRRVVTSAVVDLMSRGRKRGLAGVLATQRIARMSKSVASEAVNFLIGHNTLDLDIRRAAEMIGWDTKRAMRLLPSLRTGSFVASGPAFNISPATVAIGAVRSKHLGAAPKVSAPPLPSAEEASELLGLDDLHEAAASAEEARLPASGRAVRGFIADPSAPLAMRVFDVLRPLYPEGLLIRDLADFLEAREDEIEAALGLLTGWNAIGRERLKGGDAARLERGIAERIGKSLK